MPSFSAVLISALPALASTPLVIPATPDPWLAQLRSHLCAMVASVSPVSSLTFFDSSAEKQLLNVFSGNWIAGRGTPEEFETALVAHVFDLDRERPGLQGEAMHWLLLHGSQSAQERLTESLFARMIATFANGQHPPMLSLEEILWTSTLKELFWASKTKRRPSSEFKSSLLFRYPIQVLLETPGETVLNALVNKATPGLLEIYFGKLKAASASTRTQLHLLIEICARLQYFTPEIRDYLYAHSMIRNTPSDQRFRLTASAEDRALLCSEIMETRKESMAIGRRMVAALAWRDLRPPGPANAAYLAKLWETLSHGAARRVGISDTIGEGWQSFRISAARGAIFFVGHSILMVIDRNGRIWRPDSTYVPGKNDLADYSPAREIPVLSLNEMLNPPGTAPDKLREEKTFPFQNASQ